MNHDGLRIFCPFELFHAYGAAQPSPHTTGFVVLICPTQSRHGFEKQTLARAALLDSLDRSRAMGQVSGPYCRVIGNICVARIPACLICVYTDVFNRSCRYRISYIPSALSRLNRLREPAPALPLGFYRNSTVVPRF